MRVAAGKLEIREFFNFSCPHCFRLQGPFSRWRNESDLSDIVIIHQPVVFERYHGHYARAYYTMEALGLAKEYYGKMFAAIHRNRKLLNSKGRLLTGWRKKRERIAIRPKKFMILSRSAPKRREPRMPPLFMALTARHSLLLPENTY